MGWLNRLKEALGRSPGKPGTVLESRTPAALESDVAASIANESATQFVGHRTDREPADLVIGLDFGTSCTKVVVRSPYMYRSRAVAVKWYDNDSTNNSYLLPTVLYGNMGGELELVPTRGVRGSPLPTSRPH